MKAQLDGVFLLDSSFRHVLDPFGAVPTPAAMESKGGVSIEVVLLGVEEPNQFIVQLQVKVESPDASPQARYAVTTTHAVMLRVDPEGRALPDNIHDQVIVLGATIGFPYAREVVSTLTGRGRFGPIWLSPQVFTNLIPKDESSRVSEGENAPQTTESQ